MLTRTDYNKFAEVAKKHVEAGNMPKALAIYYAVIEVNTNANFNQGEFCTKCGLSEYFQSLYK